MSLNELKALNKETIQQLGLVPHELWLAKLGHDIWGPFELETLSQFSKTHQDICEELLLSRMDVNDWQPFYEHVGLERVSPKKEKPVQQVEKYWLLVQGQKKGPLSLLDIEKKLEMGILSHNDLVSKDDGDSWHKLIQDDHFADQCVHTAELPVAPSEESFQKAKVEVIEHLHQTHHSTEENLAGMTYLVQNKDKTSSLKIDEITIKSVATTEIAPSLKWKIPAAAAATLVVALGVNSFMNSTDEVQLEEASIKVTQKEVIMPKPARVIQPQRPQDIQVRNPASLRPHHERSALTMPNYEAYSTHQEAPQEDYHQDEPQDHTQNQNQPPQEHSLLGNQNPQSDEYGADNVPNEPVRDVASEIPAVEEVGDF